MRVRAGMSAWMADNEKRSRAPSTRLPSARMATDSFLQEFFRNWKTVGAVAPSSPALATRMMESAQVGQAAHVLELGPGTGAFTGAILDSMPHNCRYLGIELNGAFVAKLRGAFPGLDFREAGAQEFDFGSHLEGKQPFDVIVSGLPWTAFPPDLQRAILGNVLPHLKPGGRFATFAYYGFHQMPGGRRFRGLLHELLPGVESSRVVWRNLPPAFVYVGRK
ncbi:MAG TPA: methyltransferase [Verrucomicrobiales bacterium]|nr:methyltransferase [Verrucomicrobiales bacterium]